MNPLYHNFGETRFPSSEKKQLWESTSANFSKEFHQYVHGMLHSPSTLTTVPTKREVLPSLTKTLLAPTPSNTVETSEPPSTEKPPSKQFSCFWEGCFESFATRTGLATHCGRHLKIARNTNDFVCRWNNCNLSLSDASQLAKHLSSQDHIGQMPYMSKSSSEKKNKSFVCTIENCGKTFASSSNLKKHEVTHNRKRKRFYCTGPGCFKSYSTKTDLKIHLKVHKGEYPHKCSFPGCTKAFIRLSELYAHERVHDNILPHECNICEKRFREKSRLEKHYKNNHMGNELNFKTFPELPAPKVEPTIQQEPYNFQNYFN